ncbi:hypothetical protein H0A36_19905 [Endozoicomonas sp. SM1973]|uniref:Uncharacterized protein n=1 Tax=Spartinivicinus marinus TaxID=2994442 RepID=A0A853IE05_9GAMM|nr:hypothetical protein [Spartinivicinus marinus]MCX4025694.1 hypothetical protein [Spartinivicinus marinus]NYZ68284.1 hypothetical protein [Spartinivicinus marinus]
MNQSITIDHFYNVDSLALQELYDHCAGTNWQEPQSQIQHTFQKPERFNINIDRPRMADRVSDQLEGQSERYDYLKGDSLMGAIFIDSIQQLAI